MLGVMRVLWAGIFLSTVMALAQMPLPDPWHETGLRHVQLESFPAFDHGYLVSFRRWTTNRAKTNLLLHSFATGENHQIAFWPEGISDLWIGDVAVTSNQHVIVAGSFFRLGDSTQRNFFAELDLGGHVISQVDLGDYEPERVCAFNDGTLWALGQVWSAESRHASYPLLRNYSVDGQLLSSHLERRYLASPDLNLANRTHFGRRAHFAVLSCGTESVGAYIGPTRTWVEVEPHRGAEEVWQLPPPPLPRITGLALLGSHIVYASFKNDAFSAKRMQGLYILRFGLGTEIAWDAIPGTVSMEPTKDSFWALLGHDGSSLVYLRNRAEDPSEMPVFFWSKP